jgi:hypothetical protein
MIGSHDPTTVIRRRSPPRRKRSSVYLRHHLTLADQRWTTVDREPLDPDQILGAAHELMRSDGALFSMLPDFQPYMSRTSVALAGDEQTYDDVAPREPKAGP